MNALKNYFKWVLSACDLTATNMLYIYDFKVKIQNTLILRQHISFKTNNQRFVDKKAKMDQLYAYVSED